MAAKKFGVIFRCDTDAFCGGWDDHGEKIPGEGRAEIARILRVVIEDVDSGRIDGPCVDFNSTRVGSFALTTTRGADDAVSVFDAAIAALREILKEASGFSQRQSERRGFTDACLRMNRIERMANCVLKSVGR